jgi:hypothetical protein
LLAASAVSGVPKPDRLVAVISKALLRATILEYFFFMIFSLTPFELLDSLNFSFLQNWKFLKLNRLRKLYKRFGTP